MDQENRVVVLIDMDCFYCQVEEKLNPELKGKPIAVVQYNPWKGGGIIAVNYVARAQGVTRGMRGDEAREKCPDIELPSVPCQRGKADISKYREAGKEVARVLQKFTTLLERASIDEAYLDITAPVQERLKSLNVNIVTTDIMPNTFALGYDCVDEFLADVHTCGMDNIDFDYEHAKSLVAGAVIVSEIRAAVYNETGYTCSAGIAHNKILAKLVCGMNKPNKQTILPRHSINILYKTLSLKKVKHLGGKFGETVCEVLKISKMGDLQRFSEKELQAKFDEKNGTWLYNIARGTDLEPVQARFNPKSIGCCKQFRGKAALVDLDSLRKWLKDLGDEIDDRLEKDALENNRTPKQMVVSYSTQMPDGRDTSSSRSYNFVADDELCGETFSSKALDLVLESSDGTKVSDCEGNRRLKCPIKFLGISVGKFEDNSETKKTKKIKDYFGASTSKEVNSKENIKSKPDEKMKQEDKRNCRSIEKDFIMKKFFQVSEKQNILSKVEKSLKTDCNSEKSNQIANDVENNSPNASNNKTLEITLEKQESFFAKMLNQNQKTRQVQETLRPDCDVIKCGEDSNDTDYSGSTINMEIDKSIALFEDDPEDVARIANIRQLMRSSKISNEEKLETDAKPDPKLMSSNTSPVEMPTNIEIYECPECRKTVPIEMVTEHSDYHLALKLREEERRQVRDKIRDKKINTTLKTKTREKKVLEDQLDSKNESVASIKSFFVKVDDRIPTEMCAECGKKVSVDKIGEHLDFHEAQKLSRELNRKTNPQYTGNSVKRKRKSTSPVKKSKLACRPIDSFFR